MKWMQISVHFEYTDFVDKLLERHAVQDYLRYPMVEGKDQDGKHFGSQVFPGNFTVYHALVPDEEIEGLFGDLDSFRRSKPAHQHLQALVLPIERRLR